MYIDKMEEWYSLVRKLQDESETPRLVDQTAKNILTTLTFKKIKDRVKFKTRMGPEFEKFMEEAGSSPIVDKRTPEIVKDLLWDDEFLALTLKLQAKRQRVKNE
jgi:hypothetical protein